MDELVGFELDGGVAHIQFRRADKHNSLTLEMFEAIADAGARLHREAGARVAVLSGEGPSFCAGLDFSLMKMLLRGDDTTQQVVTKLIEPDAGPENLAQRVAYTWKTAPVPVIGALHGAVFGGGFQIAMGCDLRIAAPDTKMSIMEIRYGLIPDMGITQTLPDIVPLDVAKELAFSGREIEIDEIRALGLVTRVAEDPLAAALSQARVIARRSPDAVRAMKRLFNEAWREDASGSLTIERELQRNLIGTTNQMEAVNARLQKRDPDFEDMTMVG